MKEQDAREKSSLKKRKRHTNAYKLSVIRKLQVPGVTVASVARAEGLHENTLRDWKKQASVLEDSAETHGDKKALHSDKTPTLTKLLREFCEKARSQRPPLPLTCQAISLKGDMLSKKLLTEFEASPQLLTKEEASLLAKMVFSTSWAAEWAKRNNFVSKALVHGEAGSVDKASVVDAVASLRSELS